MNAVSENKSQAKLWYGLAYLQGLLLILIPVLDVEVSKTKIILIIVQGLMNFVIGHLYSNKEKASSSEKF